MSEAIWSNEVETLYGDTLQFVYHLALAVLVGGGLVLGSAVAPAVFKTVSSRGEAGTIFASVLQRWDGLAVLCVIVVVVTSVLKAGAFDEDPRDARILIRWLSLALMGIAVLYGSAWANPVARAIRAQTPGFDDLPDNDVRRREFRSLHARSARAFRLAGLFGAVALYLS